MERSNQMAVVVMPREALLDWVNTVSPENPVWLDELAGRANIYIIPPYQSPEEAEDYVRGYFDKIFTNELSEWFDDELLWPKDRSYEMFLEWFDVMYDVAVFDNMPRKDVGHHN